MTTPTRIRVYKPGQRFRNVPEPSGVLVNIPANSSFDTFQELCAQAAQCDAVSVGQIPQMFLLPGGERIKTSMDLQNNDAIVVFCGKKVLPVHLPSATGVRDTGQASNDGTSRSGPGDDVPNGDSTQNAWSLRLDHSIPPIAKFQRAVRRLLLIQRLEGIGASKDAKKKKLSRRSSSAGRNALDGRIKEMVNLYEYNAKRQAMDEQLPPLMLHPESPVKVVWDIAMLCLVVFFAIMVPYRIGFDIQLNDAEAQFDFAADVLFILDIVLSFRTAYKVDGVLVTDWRAIAHDYGTTWLPVDIMASFPIGWFVQTDGGAGKINKLFRMLRLFKLFRILRLLKLFPRVMMIIESSIKLNPSLLRFLRSFVAMFMLWHFIGCSYYFMVREELGGEANCIAADGTSHTCFINHCVCGTSDPDDFQILEETDSNWYDANHRDYWVPHPEVADWSYSRKYWTSMFWAVEVTTGVGDDIIPKSNLEIGFTVFMAVIGLMMYSVVIGSASSALQNMDTAATERRQTLDRITQYMRARKVPTFFQKIIKDFYNHMWSNPTATDEAFNELPPNLRSKLTVVVNRDLVDRIPILRTLPADIYIKAVEKFTHATFLPGEYIIRQGEVGDELFLIKRGKVDGVLPNGVTVFSTYIPGDYIGEHALLTGNRRDASYRAVDFVDCLVVSRTQFRDLTQQAPPFISKIKMTDMIRQKARLQAELDYMQDNGLDRLYASAEEEAAATAAKAANSAVTKVRFKKELADTIDTGVKLLRKASSLAMGLVRKPSSLAAVAMQPTEASQLQVIKVHPASGGSQIARTSSGRSLYTPPFSAVPHKPSGCPSSGSSTPNLKQVHSQPLSSGSEKVENLSDNSDSDESFVNQIDRGSQLFAALSPGAASPKHGSIGSGFVLSSGNSSAYASPSHDTKSTPSQITGPVLAAQPIRQRAVPDPQAAATTSQRALVAPPSSSAAQTQQHRAAPSDPTRSSARSVNSASSGTSEHSPRDAAGLRAPAAHATGKPAESTVATSPRAGKPKADTATIMTRRTPISHIRVDSAQRGHLAKKGRLAPGRLAAAADASPARLEQFDTLLKSSRKLVSDPLYGFSTAADSDSDESHASTSLVPTKQMVQTHRRRHSRSSVTSASSSHTHSALAGAAGSGVCNKGNSNRTVFDVSSRASDAGPPRRVDKQQQACAVVQSGHSDEDSLEFDLDSALD